MMFPGMSAFNPAAFAMPPGADGAAEAKTENGVSEAKSEVGGWHCAGGPSGYGLLRGMGGARLGIQAGARR